MNGAFFNLDEALDADPSVSARALPAHAMEDWRWSVLPIGYRWLGEQETIQEGDYLKCTSRSGFFTVDATVGMSVGRVLRETQAFRGFIRFDP